MAKKVAMPLSSTYFSGYRNRQTDNLTESELANGTEYIEWYVAAYDGKDERGIFDLWKTIDDYWEGHANEQQYIDDPASNTNIIHPMIEGQVALMSDDNWEAQPTAQTPSELEYIPSVKRMLDFVYFNNKFFQILDTTSRRLLKYGTGVITVQYDPKWGDDFGLPIIRSCNPTYVYPDPNIVDVYSIQEGRYIIETSVKSIAWAERMFPEKADLIIPGYDPHNQSTFYDENDYNTSEIQRMHYLHMMIWEKYVEGKKVKLRLTQMSGDGVILHQSSDGDFCNNKFPYFFSPCYFREGTVWGKGDAELLMDQQEQLNDLDDQMLMNARLTGNPQKWFDPSMAPDAEQWTNEHGLIIPATGGAGAVGYLDPPSMPMYPIQKRNRIMDNDAPAITRFYPQMAGGRIKGVDTATEALSMQQSGMTGIDHKKKLLAAMLAEVTEYIFDMCLFYWDEEKYFALTDSDDFEVFNPSSMNRIPVKEPASYDFARGFKNQNPLKELPEYQLVTDDKGMPKTKKAQIRFNFTIGAGLPKNKAFLYTAMKELYAMQLVDPETAKKFFRDQLGLPIPVADQMNPNVPPDQMQSDTQNISGIPMSGEQLGNQQGRRADIKNPMSQTPNPSVQGLNANDMVKFGG